MWHKKLKRELIDLGFVESSADPGLFIKETGNDKIYVLVYVDDLLIASKSIKLVNQVKQQLTNKFDIRDLGEATAFLGMTIERDHDAHTIKLAQPAAIKDILVKYNMEKRAWQQEVQTLQEQLKVVQEENEGYRAANRVAEFEEELKASISIFHYSHLL